MARSWLRRPGGPATGRCGTRVRRSCGAEGRGRGRQRIGRAGLRGSYNVLRWLMVKLSVKITKVEFEDNQAQNEWAIIRVESSGRIIRVKAMLVYQVRKQSPDVKALGIALEENKGLALLLAFHPFLLALTFAEFLDGPAEEGLGVVVSPLLDQRSAQVALVAVHYIVAQHAHIRLRVPPALLLREHYWQAVRLEHGPDHRHEPRKVLVQQFQVAHEGEQFVDAGAQGLKAGEDEMLVDGVWLGGVEEGEGEAVLPLLVPELDVGVRDALVLAVPDFQPVHLGHLVEHVQLLDLEVRGLDDGLVSALAALVLEAVHLADEGAAVWTALVAFGPVVVDLELVVLVALGDVVMVGDALHAGHLVLPGGGVIAGVPVVAVDQEHVLGVEVVAVQLVDPLLLVLQDCLHAEQFLFGVDHVDGPLLTALLLADGGEASLEECAGVDGFEGVVALYFLEEGEGVAGLDARPHVLLRPVHPDHVKPVVSVLHLLYHQLTHTPPHHTRHTPAKV